ncbi:MAG: DHH family phosphoesterase [Candidatus Omnitrophica bacterium]|nr:DHH family phosphoesterase [Candidatus Omnitrophota bacterium]
MANFKQAVESIREAKSIVISCHINPDGDAIGSLLSLGLGLIAFGKKVYMISEDGVPKKYRRLPGAGRIKRTIDKKCDLAISVDCSAKDVLGKNFEKVFVPAKKILEIDHHDFRRPFGDVSLIDNGAAAVGEITFTLLNKLNITITEKIAENILTSIIVETDSFRLPKVRPFTFRVCEYLVNRGVNYYKLADMIFWSKSKEAAILSGLALSRCKFLKNGRIGWSIIKRKDFERIKGKEEDADAVADEIRSIHDVRITILLRENDNALRVSLRSKGKINVARLAEHYGGGGHFDVAGCHIPNNKKAINDLFSRAKKLL